MISAYQCSYTFKSSLNTLECGLWEYRYALLSIKKKTVDCLLGNLIIIKTERVIEIRQIKYIIAKETDPYRNLALEEYLLYSVGNDECILYLWQNENTVVIGRNQNPWKECKVKELSMDGGKMVRRLSGGGAVYHDLGNLNFTFLLTKDNYDLEKQLEVIVRAVNSLGIPAKPTGRNDITVEGRKFSGNAFFNINDKSYHHGTILVDVDMSSLSKYLNVSRKKLQSKGVDSVKSRVTNLIDYRPDITIDILIKELIKAFGETYGLVPRKMDISKLPVGDLELRRQKFSSWDWNYGKKIEFTDSISRRFDWGDIELQMNVKGGVIQECVAYSDALEAELFSEIGKKLVGCIFEGKAMESELTGILIDEDKKLILEDICFLLTLI